MEVQSLRSCEAFHPARSSRRRSDLSKMQRKLIRTVLKKIRDF